MPERSTIYEVARRSAVSTATVSRVMSGGRGFSDATRERVLAAAGELGWTPNGSARGLAARRAGIVGVLFPDLGKAADAESESALFVDQVIRGAERAATVSGSAVLLAGTRGPGGRDLARSVAAKVDGLVVVARSLPDRELVAVSQLVPVVVLAASRSVRRLDVVTADNRAGSHALTTHLIREHGHRDLAFLAGPPRSPDSLERFAGFGAALADAGLPVPATPDAYGGFTEQGGEAAMREILAARGRSPRAVVAGNDEMALGALTALRAAGLRVPADVAVTGFDDILAARHCRPTLTTVRQPMREIGEQAVHVLLARIADPDAPRRTVTLPTDVVRRRSCGCSTRPNPTRPNPTRPTPPRRTA